MGVFRLGATGEGHGRGGRLRETGNTFLSHDGLNSSSYRNDHGVKNRSVLVGLAGMTATMRLRVLQNGIFGSFRFALRLALYHLTAACRFYI